MLIIGCSTTPEPADETKESQLVHVSMLEAIPPLIQQMENVTVYPGDLQPIYSLELIPKQTYGKSGEPYMTNIQSAVVDDKGRLIVWNFQPDYMPILYVFNDDGTFYSQLGSQGGGPGEYGHIAGLHTRGSKIYVYDHSGQRMNEYSTEDYSLLRTILLEQWYQGGEAGYIEPRNDGNYLATFPDSRSKLGRLETKYLVMDSLGNRINFEPLILLGGFRIGVGEVLRPTMPLRFMGTTLMAISDEDVIHTVFTRELLVKKYDAKGSYQSSIYYPIQGLPFNLEEHTPRSRFDPNVRDIRNEFVRINDALPKTYPVVESLMVDDENRIWVALPMDTRNEMLEWWVLAPSGELLAKMQRRQDLRFVVRNGYLYGKEVDQDTGVDFVVKYSINLMPY